MKIPNIDHFADIALDICGGVIGKPLVGWDILIINSGISSLPENGKQVFRCVRERKEFFKAGGQENQDSTTSGKGLGNGLGQAKVEFICLTGIRKFLLKTLLKRMGWLITK